MKFLDSQRFEVQTRSSLWRTGELLRWEPTESSWKPGDFTSSSSLPRLEHSRFLWLITIYSAHFQKPNKNILDSCDWFRSFYIEKESNSSLSSCTCPIRGLLWIILSLVFKTVFVQTLSILFLFHRLLIYKTFKWSISDKSRKERRRDWRGRRRCGLRRLGNR